MTDAEILSWSQFPDSPSEMPPVVAAPFARTLERRVNRLKVAAIAAIEAASKYGAAGMYEEAASLKQEFAEGETIREFETLRKNALKAARLKRLLVRAHNELSLSRAKAFEAEDDVRCALLTFLINAIDAEGKE